MRPWDCAHGSPTKPVTRRVRRKLVVRKSCTAVGADNASSRLRRDVHPMDLTTHMHSSEKPNRAFRQYWQRGKESGADGVGTALSGLRVCVVPASSLARPAPACNRGMACHPAPAFLHEERQRSPCDFPPLLPGPLPPAPISPISGSNNSTGHTPQAA